MKGNTGVLRILGNSVKGNTGGLRFWAVSKVIQVCPEEVQGNIALKYKFSPCKFCV